MEKEIKEEDTSILSQLRFLYIQTIWRAFRMGVTKTPQINQSNQSEERKIL